MIANQILLLNAITDAMRDIAANPDTEDSMIDIFNEHLKVWETGLVMDNDYVIQKEFAKR